MGMTNSDDVREWAEKRSAEKIVKLTALCEDLISYMEDPFENHHLQGLAEGYRKQFEEIKAN